MAEITPQEAVIREFDELGIRFNAHALTESVNSIGHIALADIEADYGAEGRNPLAYHNARHAMRVARYGLEIARRAGLDHLDQAKVVIACLCHDRFQEEGSANEDLSGEYAVELMRETSAYYWLDYASVYLAVQDTRCKPGFDSIGQAPKTRLGRIVADADVYYFGEHTSTAWTMGLDYFRELHPGEPVKGEAFRRYAERFARILRTHRYHMPVTAGAETYLRMKVTADYADSAARTAAA